MPEDKSSAVIIRCYDVSGSGGEAVLELFKEIKSAVYVDAHENETAGDKPEVTGKQVKIRMKAYGVTAVKLCL